MAGIYFHIPFCKQACNYCDFHFSTNLQLRDEMTLAMLQELDARAVYLQEKSVGSIYFGGGTPSILSVNDLQSLLDKVRQLFNIERGAEITLEVNPDDVNDKVLGSWRKIGINRLSIGLQSFKDEELRWMNRAHKAIESIKAVQLSKAAGFDNISVDLIYGSKFQTLDSWRETLEQTIELGPQHISAYNLTVEDKTALGHQVRKGMEPRINDELSSLQFIEMINRLNVAGYEQYEISNFSKPGFRARHNSSYWLQQVYLGIGPSAHSFNGVGRQWNVRNNNVYIRAVKNRENYFETEELSKADLFNEYVLTRLRTSWGCDEKEIAEKFGKEFLNHFKEVKKKHLELFENKTEQAVLNEAGKLQADGIASDFFILKKP